MKQISIALLGMGRIGRIHFRDISQHFSQASVVAVADALVKKEDFIRQHPDIYFSNNAEDVVKRQDVDAVLICTPTSSHFGLIDLAIKYGKSIFCEKPMDLSLTRTFQLANRVQKDGVRLMLGFNRRFDPDFLQARQRVVEGKAGNIHIIKITSRDPGLPPMEYIKNSGGLFMDMAIHDFDMARYITGKKVTEVFAKGSIQIDKKLKEFGDIDTALTTLIFEDGTFGLIDNSRQASYGYDQRLEVFGSKGMIQVENNFKNQNVVFDENGIHSALPLDFFMDRYAASYLKEMEIFIDALVNNKPFPVGVEDGLQATLLAYAANESIKKGGPVKLEEMERKIN